MLPKCAMSVFQQSTSPICYRNPKTYFAMYAGHNLPDCSTWCLGELPDYNVVRYIQVGVCLVLYTFRMLHLHWIFKGLKWYTEEILKRKLMALNSTYNRIKQVTQKLLNAVYVQYAEFACIFQPVFYSRYYSSQADWGTN